MRLVLLGFLVFFCRRVIHELKKTVHQYDEAQQEAKNKEAEGKATS